MREVSADQILPRADGVLHERLEAFLRKRIGTPTVRITGFRRHVEGFSWETYSMVATWSPAGGGRVEQGLVMHRVPTAGLLEPYDVTRQFSLLSALRDEPDVPVAEPLWIDADGTVVGRPMYVVERVEGDSPTPWTVGSYFEDHCARHAVGREFAVLAAAIHRVPQARLPAGLIGEGSSVAVEAVIEHWESQYRRSRLEAFPAADYIFGWLRRNRSLASGRVGLVHGDFRVGNFIIRDGHLAAMLDWETAHLGDPAEDLAYATVKNLRGGRRGDASGLLPLDDFLAAYEDEAGWTVPRTAIQYWWVMIAGAAIAQWLTAVRHFESGRTRDVRYAALGYQLAYQIKDAFANIEALRIRRPPWQPPPPRA